MSDTVTVTAEERAEIRRLASQTYRLSFNDKLHEKLDKLLDALEQAEARVMRGETRAETLRKRLMEQVEYTKTILARAKQAEARVKSRNNHIHRLLGEALENERNLDDMKSRWQTAEAENARLREALQTAESALSLAHHRGQYDLVDKALSKVCTALYGNKNAGQKPPAGQWLIAR